MQQIKQNLGLFGRIGKNVGESLAEQIPRETERNRLSSGLKKLGEQQGLSPFQRFSELAAIPGVTPQILQSGSELLRHQSQADALSKFNENNQPVKGPERFPGTENAGTNENRPSPSITNSENLAKSIEGYVEPTQDQIISDAGVRYNKRPEFYGNNPQNAIDEAKEAATRNRQAFEDYKAQHANLTQIQDNVVNRLKSYANGLGVEIPPNLYSKIEDKAIQATKPKSEGGRGLTEQQAIKEFGTELDDRSRDYEAIKPLTGWSMLTKSPSDTLKSIKSLQNKFDENDDTENFAKSLISEGQHSPKVAFSLAQPIYKVPELNREMKNIKPLTETDVYKNVYQKGFSKGQTPESISKESTLAVSKKLFPLLGKKGSILAVANELDNLGYDSDEWLDYVEENRDKLSVAQARQLDEPRAYKTLDDWWLSSFSGIDKR